MGVGGDTGRTIDDLVDAEIVSYQPSVPIESQAPDGRECQPYRKVQAALRFGRDY